MLNLSTSLKQQSGVVLVISLVMLLLLTLIGITAMQTTSLEEKMAGNSRERNIAFQAAEAALREAEKFILANPTTVYTGNNGLLNTGDAEPDFFLSSTWNASNSQPSGLNINLYDLDHDPRFIIKKMSSSPTPPTTTFRITARAVGNQPGTQVILQEVYVRTN